MKRLVLIAVIMWVWIQTAQSYVDLNALQEELHRRGDPWIAGKTSVSDLPLEVKRKMLGLWPRVPGRIKIVERKSKKAPPPSWDWRTHNGHCWMTRIRDQQNCGSCWDFGCMATLEARWNIWNNQPQNDLDLSEQFVLSCNPYGYSCAGGRAAPYDIVDWGGTPHAWEPMKYEIMRGPIAIGISVKEDFFYYKGGVYEPIMGDDMGSKDGAKYNHGVCYVGWTSSGAWIFKNSWGPGWGSSDMGCWGENGYGEINEAGWPLWMDPIAGNAPFVKVEKVRIENDNNANHQLEPGENADILITLKNMGLDVTGVSSILHIGGTGIMVTDSTANYGDIMNDSSATNTSDPFHVEVSAGASLGPREVTISVTGDGGAYTAERYFEIWVGQIRIHWADIVANSAVLTTTDNSAVGFDTLKGNGSGFIYPADILYTNTLYSGTMAFGNSSSYIVDNWYIFNQVEHDWIPTTSPDGRLFWVSPPTRGDTMVHGQYADSGHPTSKNVLCEHDAWGFTSPNCGDFVILSYKYTNYGTDTLSGLYSAVFCDFDIGAVAKQQNNANINESKYLAWVDDGNVYAGITLLDSLDLFANASTIKNQDYMWPTGGMTDENQYKFMNYTHHFGAQSSDDYSVVVSAGPFDLPPGESKICAFAIVGGTSQSEIEAHTDSARECYQQIGVEEKIPTVSWNATLEVVPHPILNTATITFSLPTASNVTINIYDITGRHLQNIAQEYFKPGVHRLPWNINRASAGVFFLKLLSEETTLVKKVIIF